MLKLLRFFRRVDAPRFNPNKLKAFDRIITPEADVTPYMYEGKRVMAGIEYGDRTLKMVDGEFDRQTIIKMLLYFGFDRSRPIKVNHFLGFQEEVCLMFMQSITPTQSDQE